MRYVPHNYPHNYHRPRIDRRSVDSWDTECWFSGLIRMLKRELQSSFPTDRPALLENCSDPGSAQLLSMHF
jgi:hypothetical protein